MVCYTEMSETKEASIIIPIDRKVERGNEAQQSYQCIDDAEDAVVCDRLSHESGGDSQQACNQVEDIAESISIKDAKDSYYSCAVLCGSEETDHT